jgi:hypothetical protein
MNLPPAAPAVLRPRRIWFAGAALIGVGGVLAAASVMLLGLRSGDDLGQRVVLGQPVTVHLSWSAEKMVWIKEAGQNVPQVRCDASPVDQTIQQLQLVSVYVTSDNLELEADDERWRGLLALRAEPGGQYEVACVATGDAPSPTLSIGDAPRLYDARAMMLGSLAALGVASIGVTTGGVLAVIVAVRRSRNRASSTEPAASPGNETT